MDKNNKKLKDINFIFFIFFSVKGVAGRLGPLPRSPDGVAASSPFHVLGGPRTVDQRP